MPYIFVHGTLRSGYVNNALIAGSDLLGVAETAEQYALCMIDDKPLVTKRPLSTIKGEVYSVTDEMLAIVDRVEAHPRVNRRELVSAKFADGSAIEAWLYFYIQPMRNSVAVESGDYAKLKA